VVENSPSNAGDAGLIPDQGSKVPYAAAGKPACCNCGVCTLWSPCSFTRESPGAPQVEKVHVLQQRPRTAKILKKTKNCTYNSVHFIKLTLMILMRKSIYLATSHSFFKLKQRKGLWKNYTLILNLEICSGLQREAFRASWNSEFLLRPFFFFFVLFILFP